jgi:hypothetical protein
MGAADTAISFATAQLGKPYVFGATGPNAYDCSGLTYAAFKSAGVSLGRTTYQQILDGTEVARGDLAPGDLVFPDAGHVQIYVGNNQVIEAPHSGAYVRMVRMWGFWRARRVTAPGQTATGNSTTVGVSIPNPLNPSSWPVLEPLNKIAGFLTDPEWWKRLGIGAIGILIIALGLAFINRKRIEALGADAAKAAGTAAVL